MKKYLLTIWLVFLIGPLYSMFVDDISLRSFIKKGIRKGEHNDFFKAIEYMSWDRKKEALLKTIEFPYFIGFKTLYKSGIPVTKEHWLYARLQYQLIRKGLKEVELIEAQEKLRLQMGLYSDTLELLKDKRDICSNYDTQKLPYANIAQISPYEGIHCARQDQENIKAIGRILKNHLSFFTERGGISKEGFIVALPQHIIECIAYAINEEDYPLHPDFFYFHFPPESYLLLESEPLKRPVPTKGKIATQPKRAKLL